MEKENKMKKEKEKTNNNNNKIENSILSVKPQGRKNPTSWIESNE